MEVRDLSLGYEKFKGLGGPLARNGDMKRGCGEETYSFGLHEISPDLLAPLWVGVDVFRDGLAEKLGGADIFEEELTGEGSVDAGLAAERRTRIR